MTEAGIAVQPEVLSTPEFFSRVLDPAPRVVVFDCDGTLWGQDAGTGFLSWSMEHGMVSRETTDWILGRYSEYRAGKVSEIEICGDMTRMYAGLREEELRSAARKFFREQIAPHTFAEMLELAQKLTAQGAELWAVSSTNHWVIEEGVREFGIAPQRVLAARALVRDGLATDTMLAVPSGPAKRDALELAGLPKPDAVLGNSIHDEAMLAIAATPFAVNPTPALLESAAAERWPVYWPLATRGQ